MLPNNRKSGRARTKRQHRPRPGNNRPSSNIVSSGPRRQATDLTEKWMPVFASKTTRRLRYSSNFGLTATSGIVASYVFAANGLFDPDITSTGHQPMGFDQLMLSYNHYCVLSSKIIVTAKNILGSTPVISITAQANSTPITVIDQIIESGMSERTTLESKAVSGSVKTIQLMSTTRRFEGKPMPINDPNLCGDVGNNPAELQYYHVQLWDAAGTTSQVTCDVVLEFRAVFFEPRILTESLSGQLKRMILHESKSAGVSHRL